MGEPASWSERRRAQRIPVRGVAVLHGDDGAMHGSIENLSRRGALISLGGLPDDGALDVELRLGLGVGWASARTVRIESTNRRWRVAVAFDRLDAGMGPAIDAAIAATLGAASRRPILVLDDQPTRRSDLVVKLAVRGMTPIAPRTPLDALDLLSRADLAIDVALIAPSVGGDVSSALIDSFPWLTTAEISSDLDATVQRGIDAWSSTELAKIAEA